MIIVFFLEIFDILKAYYIIYFSHEYKKNDVKTKLLSLEGKTMIYDFSHL